MRIEAVLAALVLLADCTGAALAETRSPPRFSQAETQTIARNELLNAVVVQDPWLVRRMLDIMATAPHARGGFAGDPDLPSAPRDWQGTVEWNELVKRARAEKDARQKPAPTVSTRSSEGTIEMIDLMRKAKARKDNAGAQ
jgi:hypothetical protein